MASLTMADAASRPMKKGWVDRSDADDAEEARDVAAIGTGRAAGVARLMVNRERRASPLYERRVNNMERDEAEALEEAKPKKRRSPLHDRAEPEED